MNLPRFFAVSGRFRHPGQADGKFRSFARRAGHADRAAGNFQHTAHQRKAEAVPLLAMGGVALIELIEDAAHRRLVHAAAGIRHGNDHLIPVLGLPQEDAPARLGELDRV